MSFSKTFFLFFRLLVNWLLAICALIIILVLAFPIGFYGMALYLEPTLPSIKEIKTAPRQMPLQIYSNDNKLIGQYGNRISLPVSYAEIPKDMIHAFLAAEDASFFEHSGISVKGLGRAITELVTDNHSQTGGSTITMQVAKNYFLTPEQTFKRKLTELFLSRKIEQQLNKDEILTLYVNKIYLGEGAYGLKAAAKKYYSKSLDHLTIAEMAMLAGLPKAPSSFNPVVNPERALQRRNWILERMLSLGYINKEQYQSAVDSPIGLHLYADKVDNSEMPYLAEMARISLVNQFGSQVMNSGWRVRLTVDSKVQETANNIVRKHLRRYDNRHGWRGAEAHDVPLTNFHSFLNMHPAKVVSVGKRSFDAELKSGEVIRVPWSGMRWTRKHYSANHIGGHFSRPSQIVKVGDIIRVSPKGKSWKLVQVPRVQGSLVSLNPENGAVVALVGGYHFKYSKFNRATDGWRQPGSTIKPLIYSAALEKGYTPNSIISDSPIKIGNWRPRNSDGRYYGPMELRKALYLSRNLVSIRLLQSVGMENARNLLDQFGLDKAKLPTTLSLALGTGTASPLQMATAYSTFANGGHRVQPYLIEQIYDFDNKLLYQANPRLACAVCFNDNLKTLNEVQRKKAKKMKKIDNASYKDMSITELEEELQKSSQVNLSSQVSLEDTLTNDTSQTDTNDDKLDTTTEETRDTSINADANADRLKIYPVEYQRAEQAPRILSPSVAYEMAGILKDVIQRGTATKAKALGRADIGGKTGTTNDFRDAWFAGFHPTNTTVVWIGFDTPSTLGRRQYGGRLALPVWMDYMRFQLKNTPQQWVTLGNNAKSKKQKERTIEIGRDGDVKNSKDKKEDKSEGRELKIETIKLPTGTPYRRKAPPLPPPVRNPALLGHSTRNGLNSSNNHTTNNNRATGNRNVSPIAKPFTPNPKN